jgi:hypothetical protein
MKIFLYALTLIATLGTAHAYDDYGYDDYDSYDDGYDSSYEGESYESPRYPAYPALREYPSAFDTRPRDIDYATPRTPTCVTSPDGYGNLITNCY